jgi:hypothetical protein
MQKNWVFLLLAVIGLFIHSFLHHLLHKTTVVPNWQKIINDLCLI